ncbi:MAG: hypothetical protein KAR84_00390 [Elusimicrobiales bacterium]|nr:hypothetical protein [Elusimicrobiales bacterium]
MDYILKIIPPIVLPKWMIECWLFFHTRKGSTEFEKTIRRLSYYATNHGAMSSLIWAYGSVSIFMMNKRRGRAFIRKCHEGFSIAQKEIVRLLPDIEAELPKLKKKYKEEVRRYRKNRVPPVPKYSSIGKAYSEAIFKSETLREIANAIAWQMAGNDGTKIRALIQGIQAHTEKRQLQEVYAEALKFSSNNDEFALVLDITSCVQVGDLLVRKADGRINLCELKKGAVNKDIQDLLEMPPKDILAQEKMSRLVEEKGLPFLKQFNRVLRQNKRMSQAIEYINNSIGTDIRFNLPRITNVEPIEVKTFHREVCDLMKAAKHNKSPKFIAIEECLIFGAFDNIRLKLSKGVCQKDFQHMVWHTLFEKWEDCPYGKKSSDEIIRKHFEYMNLPVWDMRDKVSCHTHTPLFINGLSDEMNLDILFERMSLFCYFSPELFIAQCQKMGVDASWITGREFNRLKNKIKFPLVDIHGGFVRLEDKNIEMVMHLGYGSLFKMIYEFLLPSSSISAIKKQFVEVPERM